MKLRALLNQVTSIQIIGNKDIEIEGLFLDSRQVEIKGLYAAIKGSVSDGHHFIPAAIEKGANAVLCEILPLNTVPQVTYIVVNNTAQALGIIAAAFYGNPSNHIMVIAITGTNGKTTCTSLLYELFTNLGNKCGLVSTVEVRVVEKVFKSTHTTPNAIVLQKYLAEMVSAGCTYCFMEASSHAIHQFRLSGLKVKLAGFTNLSHDHLDYHKTFANYRDAKKLLFDSLDNDALCIVNADDANGQFMLQNTKAAKFTYALKRTADFKGKVIEMDMAGMLLNINKTEAWYRLTGMFNASNLLLVFGVAFLLGVSEGVIITALSLVGRVPGRFEVIKSNNGIIGIIDYAHTPDALENFLKTINGIRTKNELLITVVGCGGNRDREKRPIMGKVASDLSNKVIFTSDNPREENPMQIIAEMEQGVSAEMIKKVLSISEREQAIKTAIMMANKGDIIAIAGKGHEDYQEIKGVKYPFDDREVLTKLFNQLTN